MNFCYLISSNIRYGEPLQRLLKSMEYVPNQRKLVSIGGYDGCPHVRMGTLEGEGQPNIFYSNHNSFDYTALIDWLSTVASYADLTHVFLLHDTMELTPESDALISAADPTMDATAAYEGAQCNLALFRTDWLMKNSDRILAMRNCTKAQAVAFEGVLWKDAPRRALYPNPTVKILNEGTVYDGGNTRRTELYESCGVVKYKSSWGQDMATIHERVHP